MANEKLPALKAVMDIVDEDAERLNKFIEDGLPGIGDVDGPKIEKMLELYVSGRSYSAISGIMRIKKDIVLYLSKTQEWSEKRLQRYKDLAGTLPMRQMEAEILNKDVMLTKAQADHKKFTQKLDRYLLTGIEDPNNRIDPKEYAMFLKNDDAMKKDVAAPKGPTVNVNIGNTKTAVPTITDDTIEISTNQSELTDEQRDEQELKYYADLSRQKDKK